MSVKAIYVVLAVAAAAVFYVISTYNRLVKNKNLGHGLSIEAIAERIRSGGTSDEQ